MSIEAFLQTLNARLGAVRRVTANGQRINPLPFPARGVAGVYCIFNTVTRKVYVGSGAGRNGVHRRIDDHFRSLAAGKHANRHLQHSWNKHGGVAFEVMVLVTCSADECLAAEQRWIDRCRSADENFGYNLSPTAGSSLGVRFTDETKAKIGKKAKGRRWTPEAKAKLSATLSGRPRPKEAMRGWDWTGRTHSEETKAKQSEYARNRPPEHRANLSRAARAKRLTEEHKRKIGLGQLGRKRSPETTAKLVAKLTGKKRAGTALENIRAGIRLREERRRALKEASGC